MDRIKKYFTFNFIKYLFCGGFNNAVAYAIYAGILFIDGHYIVAAFSSWVLGLVLSFFTMSKFVFNKSEESNFINFILVYVTLFIVNVLILTGYEAIDFNLYIGGFINMLAMPFMGYYLLKRFVFKTI